jgi:hypothetical protein
MFDLIESDFPSFAGSTNLGSDGPEMKPSKSLIATAIQTSTRSHYSASVAVDRRYRHVDIVKGYTYAHVNIVVNRAAVLQKKRS